MSTVVTSKGQVTIPKPVRDMLGIRPGSLIDFRRLPDGSVVVELAGPNPDPGRIARWRGTADTDMTTDEIMELLRGE